MSTANNYKCGEIFITYQGKYCYNCIICREWFDSIEYYEDHYMVQHFESKELYGEDGESFRIKIEPITEYDLECIKSEINSEDEEYITDSIDTENFKRLNVKKHKKFQSHIRNSINQESESSESSDVVVTIEENTENDIETFEPDILEWNESDRDISIDEINYNQEEELDSNNENLNESNLIIEKQDIVDESLICQICFVSCTSFNYFNHVFEHKEPGNCPVCKKRVNNLNNHSKRFHKKYFKPDRKNQIKLKASQLKKKSEKKESIFCKYCKKQFFFVNALEHHEKLHENSELNCKYCNKSYRDLRFLRYHMRKHTGERPFKCELCEAAFATKDNLNTHHIYKHTDSYNFSCTYENCNKKFKTKELRKRHIKNIHLRVLGYQCDICGEKFMTSSRLSIHKVKSHIEPEEWPYKCEFCEKPFILQCKLREHINYHTGEKPFKCDICDQKFMKRRNLNDHKKKIHEILNKN